MGFRNRLPFKGTGSRKRVPFLGPLQGSFGVLYVFVFLRASSWIRLGIWAYIII